MKTRAESQVTLHSLNPSPKSTQIADLFFLHYFCVDFFVLYDMMCVEETFSNKLIFVEYQ